MPLTSIPARIVIAFVTMFSFRKVGKVTSGTFSPLNKVGLGMAMIDFNGFKSNEFYIEIRNKLSKAMITKLSI